jgi:hypothetical protein
MIRLLVGNSGSPPPRLSFLGVPVFSRSSGSPVVRVVHLLPGLNYFNPSLCDFAADELLQAHKGIPIVCNDLLLIANLNPKAV